MKMSKEERKMARNSRNLLKDHAVFIRPFNITYIFVSQSDNNGRVCGMEDFTLDLGPSQKLI
jgi:hypothetical protein